MNNAKRTAKQLPEMIGRYTLECISSFFDEIARELNVPTKSLTDEIMDAASEEVFINAQQVLTDNVIPLVLEDCGVAYGNSASFNEQFNHIMFYIHDPEGARNSLQGERPTSKVYDVYETIFGKYHYVEEMYIIMLYDICYYILMKKAPKYKSRKAAIDNYAAAIAYAADNFKSIVE